MLQGSGVAGGGATVDRCGRRELRQINDARGDRCKQWLVHITAAAAGQCSTHYSILGLYILVIILLKLPIVFPG